MMQSDCIILPVPVRRYVLKFITQKYGLAEGEPWRIGTRGGKERIFMYSLLERTPNRYEKYRKSEAVLMIAIPLRIYFKRGSFLSQESIELFNSYIQAALLDEITLHYFGVKAGIGLKKCPRVVTTVHRSADGHERNKRIPASQGTRFFAQDATIYDILGKYDIGENDLTLDSILKHVNRRANAA